MAGLTKEQYQEMMREKYGYDDMSDDDRKQFDSCIDESWDAVMEKKDNDSQDTNDTDKEKKSDSDDSGEPEGRNDREIDHKTTEKEEEELDI